MADFSINLSAPSTNSNTSHKNNHNMVSIENESVTDPCNCNINIMNKTCDYYTTEMFNKIKITDSHLSIISLNINSLKANIDNLAILINNLKNPDIIIISETRNNIEGLLNYYFNDYVYYIDYPKDNKCGGVVILVKRHIKHSVDSAVQLKNQYVENMVLKLKLSDKSIVHISAIYRHHQLSVKDFSKAIKQHIKMFPKNTNLVLAGDINIDLRNINDNVTTRNYLDKLKTLNCNQLIHVPTRITTSTKTLIDHIYIRPSKDIKVHRGVLLDSVSDHLPTFVIINLKTDKNFKDRASIRIMSAKNVDKFRNLFNSIDIHTFSSEVNNSDKCWESFINVTTRNFNDAFPYKIISRSKFKDKPWITKGIKISCKFKESLYKKWLDFPTTYNCSKYKKYKNKLNGIIKNAKRKYYSNLFENRNNINVWKHIHDFKHGKVQPIAVDHITEDNKTITDKNQISNHFNNYFATIGENMNQTFDENLQNSVDYMPQRFNKSLKLNYVEEHEVADIIQNFSNKNSAGQDMMSQKLLKSISLKVVPTLTKLINLSIKERNYPKCLKTAKIIPLFKNGRQDSCSNYRPISLLSTFNKVFEKILHKDITNYIETNNILYINQFGFRKYHNTIDALIKTHDYIIQENRNKNKTIGIFIDLRKAFDSIDNNILIKKLKLYGIDGPYNDLLKSYLSDRTCFTVINNVSSTKNHIKFGVPQGSVLGPLLFNLYINDIKYTLNDNEVNLFADDANIFCSCKTYEEVINKCNDTLSVFSKWLEHNKLTLNVEKTHFIDFSNDKNKHNIDKRIQFKGILLEERVHTKYLGLIMQDNLKWNKHISNVINKLNSNIPIFYHIRDKISNNMKSSIYNSLALSTVRYGIELYGKNESKWTQMLQKTQNRLLKILFKQNYLTSTNLLHKSNKVLKIKHIAEMRTLLIGHRVIYNTSNINNAYANLERTNSRNTRNNLDFKITTNHFLKRNTVVENAAVVWNRKSNALKIIENRDSFKNNSNNEFLSTY